ncbi:hypothetical protein GYMLUDRAFT_47938 [Collybiopsis luxurians FD-317 M1]|uniref:Extracellular membrane protein CFEM domain-containing protein n=1 Tax=Collybiopsis luxurians FD-317 M1 TaxID=944289 RepID=A0A0D0CK16_9AGAR|nr:hypothetical protein GYMLUDRAFT_47938 [Collybiopsis luxurians FD-317 M1]
MHRAFFVFLQIACFAFLARTSTGLPNGHGSFRVISIRQDSDIPTQCQSICDPVVSPLEDGTCTATPSVCCTNTFIQNLAGCFECVGNLSGTTNYSVPQTTVDAIFEECALEGINITDPTLPGQNSHRTLSGLPTSSTAHVSGSGSSSSHASSSSSSVTTTTPHQSTVTAVSFTPTPSNQVTVTSLLSSTTPAVASPSSPVSTSATTGSSNGGSPALACSWTVIMGLIGSSWALGLML